jgi:hypothetical protein
MKITPLTLSVIVQVVDGGLAAHTLSALGRWEARAAHRAMRSTLMLSDIDLDDREVPFFVMQITNGKVSSRSIPTDVKWLSSKFPRYSTCRGISPRGEHPDERVA